MSASVPARTRLDFWFDAAILIGYTIAYSYGFTGVVIHEWLGIALGIALLLHITLHWDWVVRTTAAREREAAARRGSDARHSPAQRPVRGTAHPAR